MDRERLYSNVGFRIQAQASRYVVQTDKRVIYIYAEHVYRIVDMENNILFLLRYIHNTTLHDIDCAIGIIMLDH